MLQSLGALVFCRKIDRKVVRQGIIQYLMYGILMVEHSGKKKPNFFLLSFHIEILNYIEKYQVL